jgi:hypothetical protein
MQRHVIRALIEEFLAIDGLEADDHLRLGFGVNECAVDVLAELGANVHTSIYASATREPYAIEAATLEGERREVTAQRDSRPATNEEIATLERDGRELGARCARVR